MSATANVKVVCRFRPPNALELREAGGESIVQIDEDGTNVKLRSQEAMKGPEAQGFTFDRVFQMDTKQHEVFEFGVKDIVDGSSPLSTLLTRRPCRPTDYFGVLRRYGRLQRHSIRLRYDREWKECESRLGNDGASVDLCSPMHSSTHLQHTMMVGPFSFLCSHRKLTAFRRCRDPTSTTPR